MQGIIEDAIKNKLEDFILIYSPHFNMESAELKKELREFYKETNELNEWGEHIINMEKKS